MRADVAEALHDHRRAFEVEALLLRPLGDAMTTPCPVALSRPSVPPEATGLPVTTPLTLCLFTTPTVFMYVSMAHAMVCALVPTSGAGMSYSGPMLLAERVR